MRKETGTDLQNPGRRVNRRRAFTLVELLVVISIAAVLLSLLFPALKQARRRALLVACLHNLRQSGVAVMTYAADHDGLFPRRWDFTWDIGTVAPSTLAQLGPREDHDLRVQLDPYTAIEETFLCPLVKRVDLTLVAPRLEVDGSYNMWFGWPPEIRSSSNESSPGMEGGLRRLSDEFIYRGRRFTVLMGDREAINLAYRVTATSHPALGVATPGVADGEFLGSNQRVFSFYEGVETPDTRFDLNFMFTDGHAELIRDIWRRRDDRMLAVPTHWGYLESLLPVTR